jgi:hypothetical protein
MRADRDFYYRPSITAVLLALALAMLLAWHGMARAAEYAPPASAELPDSISQPSADRVPPKGCNDDIDMAPEDAMPSPFDAELVAFHLRAPRAMPAASTGCDRRVRTDKT